jgi:hypothetical protein
LGQYRHQRHRQFAANVPPVFCEIQAAAAMSNAAIAAKLNERRVPTAQGGVWTQVQMRGCYWGERRQVACCRGRRRRKNDVRTLLAFLIVQGARKERIY